LVTGCIPLPTDSRHFYEGVISAPVKPGESIAILKGTSSSSPDVIPAAQECLIEAIQKARSDIRVVNAEEFSKSVFPYQIPEETDEQDKYMKFIMNHHLLKEQGVRFVFLLDSWTNNDAWSRLEGLSAVVWSSTNRWSTISVKVFEFGQGKPVANFYSSADGKVALAWIALGPVMFSSLTETNACDELIPAVSKFLMARSSKLEGSANNQRSGKGRGPLGEDTREGR